MAKDHHRGNHQYQRYQPVDEEKSKAAAPAASGDGKLNLSLIALSSKHLLHYCGTKKKGQTATFFRTTGGSAGGNCNRRGS